jgi:hypothetical protein
LGVLRSRHAKAAALPPHFESFAELGLTFLVYHGDFNLVKAFYIAIVDVGEPVVEILTRVGDRNNENAVLNVQIFAVLIWTTPALTS